MNIDMFKLGPIMNNDNNARTGSLIPVLQDNSLEYHYLPEESLEYVIRGSAARRIHVFGKDGNTHTGLVILTN